MISASNYPDMTSNATIQWAKGWEDVPSEAQVIYDVENISRQTGSISSLDGFSTARRKNEGDEFAYGSLAQNYKVNWTMYTIGLMEKITWEMRKYDKYGEINRAFRNLGNSSKKRFERDLQHKLTMAASTSHTDYDGNTVDDTVGDGFQLAYATHTVPGSSTTYRNIVANNPVVSKGGLEAAQKLFTNMIDDNGEHTPRKANTIITGDNPNTVNTVKEYLKATADVTSANSGTYNVYGGAFNHIVLSFLRENPATFAPVTTYDNYWFLADLSPMAKRGFLKISEEPGLAPRDGGVDFPTQDWSYASIAAYAIAWLDGKNIVLSKGDGTA
jgi:hypothetical protein